MSSQFAGPSSLMVPARSIQIVEVSRPPYESMAPAANTANFSREDRDAAEILVWISQQPPRVVPATEEPTKTARATKRTRSTTKAKAQQVAIRQQWKKKAAAIATVPRTQADGCQSSVMWWVYREITPYPDNVWATLIAIVVGRTVKQVNLWFMNRRQEAARDKKSTGALKDEEPVEAYCLSGRTIKIRRRALWTLHSSEEPLDDAFKDALNRVAEEQSRKFNRPLNRA